MAARPHSTVEMRHLIGLAGIHLCIYTLRIKQVHTFGVQSRTQQVTEYRVRCKECGQRVQALSRKYRSTNNNTVQSSVRGSAASVRCEPPSSRASPSHWKPVRTGDQLSFAVSNSMAMIQQKIPLANKPRYGLQYVCLARHQMLGYRYLSGYGSGSVTISDLRDYSWWLAGGWRDKKNQQTNNWCLAQSQPD